MRSRDCTLFAVVFACASWNYANVPLISGRGVRRGRGAFRKLLDTTRLKRSSGRSGISVAL